jgi:hypothetical protein
MGITLQRKDKTSIFCPQPIPSHQSNNIKTRYFGVIAAFSLMIIGTWIIMNLN